MNKSYIDNLYFIKIIVLFHNIVNFHRYLEKTFSRAVRFSQPHVIVFLGDLMDEGHIANAEDFERYKRRLDSIFSMPDDIMVFILIM